MARFPVSTLSVTMVVACLGFASPVMADNAISELFSKFLHRDQGVLTDGAVVDRRIPFSNAEIQLSYAPLVKQISPSVVNVFASTRVQRSSPFSGDPFFERFFSIPQMPPRVQSALGSGVIVASSGIVVTNFHVIDGADKVRVALADGRAFDSKTLLKDETLDLAILKIDAPEALPAAALGKSDDLEIGDLVLAIGNPFGVGQTTTSGIVSALARSLGGIGDFGYFIQTDAAINPGNSGGALVNMNGEIIGINTAIYSRSGGSIGIGFAIPSDIVSAVVKAAEEGADHFDRPYSGVSADRVTPDIAEALGMARPLGALVSAVAEGGAAARAGLAEGDVVTAVNGKPIETPEALDYRLAMLPIGSKAELSVLRGGSELAVSLEIERAPEAVTTPVALTGATPFAGATVSDLSPALLQRYKLPANQNGIMIINVDYRSPAAQAGFRTGDVIRSLRGEEIKSVEQFQNAVNMGGRVWQFTLVRDGRAIQQTLRY